MRAVLLLVVLASGCGLFAPKNTTTGDSCVDDPTNVILITPTTAKMKPGDRLTFTFEIRSKKGSATAEASIASGTLEPAGSNAVALTAPPVPGSYELVVSRVGCPMDRNSAAITVEPIVSLGKAPGQQPVPSGVAWSPDGTTIAVSGRGGVWLFRADGTFIDSEKLPHQGKTTVSFSPDGKYLAVGGDVAERTWVLERENLTPWTKLGVASGSAGHLFSKDGSELYLHEGDALRAFSMTTGAMREIGPISQEPSPSDTIARLEHGPLDSVLVTVPGELRELSTGRRTAQWSGGATAISPTGRWVLASSGLQLPFVGQQLSIAGATTGPGGTIFSAALTNDGTLLATGHTGGVNVFRDDGGQLTGVGGATFVNAPGPVLDVAWSPDGSKLAVAGSTRLLILTRQQLGL
ncbi:MAG: WD40 repeat domain-containing protein [Myxococcaceae bacterium]